MRIGAKSNDVTMRGVVRPASVDTTADGRKLAKPFFGGGRCARCVRRLAD